MTTNGRALVTGGARRIGAAICSQLHAEGFDIALHFGGSEADASALAADLNQQRADSCSLYQADLADAGAVAALARRVLEDGEPSLLVNNASQYLRSPLGADLDDSWSALVGTNLHAPLELSLALRDSLARTRGSIVNLLDAHSTRPQPGYAVYDMTRNALASLTRSLALEFAPQVRVNGVAPGAILPPEGDHAGSDDPESLLGGIPLGTLGDVGDIAGAVCFLATRGDYITGQVLAVDGGRSLVS